MSPLGSALVDVTIAVVVVVAVAASALITRSGGRWRRRCRRLVDVVVTASAAVVLVGAAAAVVPGDPVARALGEDAPESARAAMTATMGLHHAVVLPAVLVPTGAGGRVLSGLLMGLVDDDRGLRSYRGEPVWEIIGPRLSSSMRLGSGALVLGVLAGMLLGAAAGWRDGEVTCFD